MTIEEYSTLMGYEETCEMAEYEIANAIYMAAGQMDKQAFCKEYKKMRNNPLVVTLAAEANSKDKALRQKQASERKTACALLFEANDVRISGLEESALAIEKIAAQMIGRKDCIIGKLSKGYKLSEADIDYILNNLK